MVGERSDRQILTRGRRRFILGAKVVIVEDCMEGFTVNPWVGSITRVKVKGHLGGRLIIQSI